MQIQAEIDNYEREKCTGAIVRSRGKYVVEGEKCTSFFLGLEKKRQAKKIIQQK